MSAPATDSPQMLELFTADQKERETVYHSPEAFAALKSRDQARAQKTYELLRSGSLKTAADLYHAAVVLQHGCAPSDFLAAHRLATLSAIMGHPVARWLSAASLDRYLMSLGLGQVYGTQFELNTSEGRYEVKLPVQEQVLLPFEKEFLGVPATADRLKALNDQLRNSLGGGKRDV